MLEGLEQVDQMDLLQLGNLQERLQKYKILHQVCYLQNHNISFHTHQILQILFLPNRNKSYQSSIQASYSTFLPTREEDILFATVENKKMSNTVR